MPRRLPVVLDLAFGGLAFVCGISPAYGQGPPTPAPSGTGVIVGQVVEAVGNRPVPGAIVTISVFAGGAARPVSVMTESRGRFVFRNLPRGSFTITATKPGFADGAYGRRMPGGTTQSLDLADGQRLGSVSITLWRHGAISGTVRDEHGDPLVGVEVRALLKTFRTGDARWVAASVRTTDDRGSYRLGGLTPGEYTVVVPSTNMVFAAQSALPPGAVMVNGKALVSGVPVAAGQERGVPYIYRTTFYPNALTSSQASPMTLRSGEEQSGIDFELTPVPTFTVSGLLTNAEVGTLQAVSIELMRAAARPDGRIASVSDILVARTTGYNDGRFTLLGVPAGQYVIRASFNQGNQLPFLSAKQTLTVGGGDVTNLVLPLTAGAFVSGRLEFEGAIPPPTPQALAQIPVSLEAIDPRDGVSQGGRVTANGRFSFAGGPASDYVIMVPGSPPGWTLKSVTVAGRDVTDRAIDVAKDLSDVVLSFTDQTTQLRGHVSNAAGPDATASVLVFPGAGFPYTELSWSNGSRRFQNVRVDKTGSYVVNRLPPGDYCVVALPEEETANWIDASFLARLAASATLVRLGDGDKQTIDLRTQQVRR